jgi:hypothetical protein
MPEQPSVPPELSLKTLSLKRVAEFVLLVLVAVALFQLRGSFLAFLLLLLWCAAPVFLRPLTTPGVSIQQRYAVGGLILGAGVTWFSMVPEGGDLIPYASPGTLSVLLIVGLVGVAGYLRLGWKKQTGQP